MSRDGNDEGELLSSDLPTGPAGGSWATGSQVGQRRLSRRDEACDPLSAQPLASRAGLAPTRDNRVTNSEGGLVKRGSRHDAVGSGKFYRRQAGSG
jgi:hypothetical protein